MVEIEIDTHLGNKLAATLYKSTSRNQLLIIASATGVKQQFYRKFAEYISANGITVITFDYAGIGQSLKQPIRTVKASAADWGRNDLEAVLQYAKENHPGTRLSMLGHSIGGQLIGLAPSSTSIDKLILVAAQSGYWKWWKGTDRIKMWLNWHLLFPTLTSLFGYMPTKKISGMENLPINVARQWSSWGRKENYLFDDIPDEHQHFDKISARLLAISIDNDFYAPSDSVDWLIEKYSIAAVCKVHLDPKDFHVTSIGHFGIFREQFAASIWKNLLNELQETN
ncbi:MAG: alpha/beta hydrolase [Flavihumibacter sp.]|jgi:predicted alpha/beta hydrolase|nr:alpha/beta hydrolase [Flavihumibacter sp.]